MACECGCVCCGPPPADSEVAPRAQLEQDKRDAERRAAELDRRVEELENEAAR